MIGRSDKNGFLYYQIENIASGRKRRDIFFEALLCNLQKNNSIQIISCVNSYIDCLSEKLAAIKSGEKYDPQKKYFPRNIHKAKVHAFLAGMEEFVPSLGLAAKKGYFDLNSEIVADIKKFIINL